MGDFEKAGRSLDETFREYLWNYFELHAGQRLATFHFYITLSTALIGGFLLLVRYGQNHKWMGVLGLLLAFLSLVFAKLDARTRKMVKNAEGALSFLDAHHGLLDVEGAPHPLRVFDRDNHYTKNAKLWPLTTGHFSYERCFRWVFVVFGIVGILTALACFVYFR